MCDIEYILGINANGKSTLNKYHAHLSKNLQFSFFFSLKVDYFGFNESLVETINAKF